MTQHSFPESQYPNQAPGQQYAPIQPVVGENPEKSFVVAFLLSLFLGGLAIDRFYLGHIGLGVAKLLVNLLTGGLGLAWVLVDLYLLAYGRLTAEHDPRLLDGYAANSHWARIVVIICLVFGALIIVGLVVAIALLIIAALASGSTSP